MMQAANLRNRHDLAMRRRLHLTWCRRVAIQRQMWPGIVIVVKVVRNDAVKMPFVQHDHVVQTLSADAADDPFAIGILPGRPWCNWDFLKTHALDTLGEIITVDVVAIANEQTVGRTLSSRPPQNPQLRIFPRLKNPLS